ncbi:MAG: hypothetical protein KKE17_04035 [Proteobacteria bacterium]|nr:hypothetical protein [Pseudomonadota bacterium]MBU1709155.1 hypothetical protein [Pseudomonadota bacterium]
MKKILLIPLFIFFSISSCGGGGGDDPSSPVKTLTITFTYDLTMVPNLTGFRFYSDSNKLLLYSDRNNTISLDTANFPSHFDIDYYKNRTDQQKPIELKIPMSAFTNPVIAKDLSFVMTAYVKYSDNTEDESAFSSPLTIQ